MIIHYFEDNISEIVPATIKTTNGKIEKDVFVYKIQENDEVQFVINKWSSKCK